MAILKTNLIEPEGATTTLGVGESGGDLVIGADSLKANVVKTAAAAVVFQSNGSGTVSNVASGWGGAQILLATATPSAQASVVFTSGIDATYKEYLFEFINIDGDSSTKLTFQCSTDGGSNYNTTLTSTSVYARHAENGTTGFDDYASQAHGQVTTYQEFCTDVSGDSDASMSGELHLFNPSSTSLVKNWYGVTSSMQSSPGSWESWVGGYFNTTTAINAISFKMDSGNITGKIKMFGIN